MVKKRASKKKAEIQLPKRVMCPAAGTWCPRTKCIEKRVTSGRYTCGRKAPRAKGKTHDRTDHTTTEAD